MRRKRNTKSETISNIVIYHEEEVLEIPHVQRDLVWTTPQKQLLIDSIMKDYDIPKLYFRIIEKDGEEKFEIIDGQQRLNAIFDYLADKFSMPSDTDDFEGEVIAGKNYSELSARSKTRRVFDS